MIRLLIMTLAFLVAPLAHAAELTLNDVLRSSATHAPQILEAMARQRQAGARALSAQGQFDLVFDGDAQSRATGFYGGTFADVKASRPLQNNGGNIYTGYRLSSGSFPSYEGKSATNQLGEVRVGAVFSLLRDRLIDERRGRRELAEADIDLAALDRDMVAIGVQRRAIEAYQQWVAAGQRVATLRELFDLAQQRQASIDRQINLGARPAILSVENRQNIVRRQALLVRAEQDLTLFANALSLFLRDDLGQPVVPDTARLPARMPQGVNPRLVDRQEAMSGRPDIQALLARIDQNSIRVRMAENELRPRLDLRAEASQDLGSGSPERTQPEALFGLRFSLPLGQRTARGRIAEVAAEQDALTIRLRFLEEQVGVEIANLRTQMDGAERLAALATDEAALARRMAEAERRRYALGASDFLVVNLREEALADATIREIDAIYRSAAARAELVAAMADRNQLGI
jgi:outer membrane protein TolC